MVYSIKLTCLTIVSVQLGAVEYTCDVEHQLPILHETLCQLCICAERIVMWYM